MMNQRKMSPKNKKGARITTVAEVVDLAKKKRSIWHSQLERAIPAAFLQNMQARGVVGFIRRGWLWEYNPNQKKYGKQNKK